MKSGSRNCAKPFRIAFYGNFGAGNLGNECSLQTAIEHVLKRWPDAQLHCLCTEPRDVEARHHVAAFRSVAQNSGWSSAARDSSGETAASRRRPRSTLVRVLMRIARVLFHRIPLELVHWARSLQIVARMDMLIVPGTGIVTDGPCGSLGWPYDLFKFSLLAAFFRVRIVFLSVGVGPIRHTLGRWFIVRSLGLARFRSYRDEDSKQYLKRVGFNVDGDPVFPDLVFGLSVHTITADPMQRRTGARIVGLGLKDYSLAADTAGTNSYRDYLEIMTQFVSWLLEHGYIVRLLIGDVQYDTRVREDLVAMLARIGVTPDDSRILAEPVFAVEDLLRQIGETEAVVSPRFHNLVLGLLWNRPVLALSDLSKVDALLNDLGLPEYRLPLDNVRPETLIERFVQMQNGAENLRRDIGEKVARYREAVDAQYELAFSGLEATKSRRVAEVA